VGPATRDGTTGRTRDRACKGEPNGTLASLRSMSKEDRIGPAYDAVAAEYDRQLEPVGWIRRALWRHLDRLFVPGDEVLDVGCGTGTDALHLARNHVRVTAVDASAGMLARLHSKLAAELPTPSVQVKLGNIDELAPELTGPFDGIISSFAALNTVDLSAFASHAARLLRPQGRMICHMLSTGYDRLGLTAVAGDVKTINVGGEPLPHLNLEPDALFRRFFQPQFTLRSRYALGFLVGKRGEAWLPGPVLDLVGRVEPIIGALPALASRGRFFVLDLERRPS
jgi:ubiquinone/menaquinone biosynthesis C-methylase UbiE